MTFESSYVARAECPFWYVLNTCDAGSVVMTGKAVQHMLLVSMQYEVNMSIYGRYGNLPDGDG